MNPHQEPSLLKEKWIFFLKSSWSQDKKNELFGLIWTNYRKKISFYIANFVPRHHPYFEDLFQEVMLRIYEGLPSFNPAHSFKAWIYAISRHRCLDFLKNKEEKIRVSPEIPDHQASPEDGPEQRAVRRGELDHLDRCLNSLSPLDQEIAFLRFYEGLKHKDIGKITGLSAGATRVRVHDIKKKLAEEWRKNR